MDLARSGVNSGDDVKVDVLIGVRIFCEDGRMGAYDRQQGEPAQTCSLDPPLQPYPMSLIITRFEQSE